MSQLIYIVSCQRSGSTLLDLMLSQHSKIQGVGEVAKLFDYASNDKLCTCGKSVLECEFWSQVTERFKEKVNFKGEGVFLEDRYDCLIKCENYSFLKSNLEKLLLLKSNNKRVKQLWKTLFSDHVNAFKMSEFWYDSILRTSGKAFLLDSSKDIRRMMVLSTLKESDFYIIYLVRDGRGVVNSLMKRWNLSVQAASKMWLQKNQQIQLALKSVAHKHLVKFLKYEDLCTNPNLVMKGIAEFLNVDYEGAMTQLDKSASHNIGGSPTRLDKSINRVEQDLAWEKALNNQDLVTFENIAGKLNKSLGYDIT